MFGSCSAPFAAGAAALYLKLHPGTSPAEISTNMVRSASTGQLMSVGLGSGSPNKVLNVNFDRVNSMAVDSPADGSAGRRQHTQEFVPGYNAAADAAIDRVQVRAPRPQSIARSKRAGHRAGGAIDTRHIAYAHGGKRRLRSGWILVLGS